jgi:hypothetical protein
VGQVPSARLRKHTGIAHRSEFVTRYAPKISACHGRAPRPVFAMPGHTAQASSAWLSARPGAMRGPLRASGGACVSCGRCVRRMPLGSPNTKAAGLPSHSARSASSGFPASAWTRFGFAMACAQIVKRRSAGRVNAPSGSATCGVHTGRPRSKSPPPTEVPIEPEPGEITARKARISAVRSPALPPGLPPAHTNPPICRHFSIGARGFEPPTARPPAGCATRLRHTPFAGQYSPRPARGHIRLPAA